MKNLTQIEICFDAPSQIKENQIRTFLLGLPSLTLSKTGLRNISKRFGLAQGQVEDIVHQLQQNNG